MSAFGSAFTGNICCQITSKAKSQRKQFDPGPAAAAWGLKAFPASRAEQGRQDPYICFEATSEVNRTMAGKVPRYVSKDPDKLHHCALSWGGVTSPW